MNLRVIHVPEVRDVEDPSKLAQVVIGVEPDRPDQRLHRLAHDARRDGLIPLAGVGQDT